MSEHNSKTFFPTTPLWQSLLLGFLLIAAFGIRVIELKMPPDDFHPTRQYWSALLARAFYLESQQSVPAWQQDVIRAQRETIGVLEPPIIELIVAQFYRSIGKEVLWIPRLLSILFWLIAGVFVFLMGRRLGSVDVAILAAAFFLFVPFGIRASRSFQPDILMVMLLTLTLYLLLRYQAQPDWRQLFWSGVVGSLATLVRPQGFFMLLITAFAIIGFQDGDKRRRIAVYLILVLLPALLYYSHEYLVNPNMHSQVQGSFVPSLWFKLFYWQFWLKHLWRVIGFSALVGGMLGIMLLPTGWRRNFLIGMWLGYVIFGLFYSYHIHTHDYYHLQFIPAVALAVGVLGAMVLQHLHSVNQGGWFPMVIGGIVLFAMFLNVGLYLNTLSEAENGTLQAQLSAEIGMIVNHSTHTLLLSPYYGYPLQYHGQLSGQAWPTLGDISSERLLGEVPLTVAERFEQLYQPASPEYFIITDMAEYSAQPDLQAFLTERFVVLQQSENFVIFDLRQQ